MEKKVEGQSSYNFDVEISNMHVDDKYYSFNFKVHMNGKLLKEGSYSSDHAWHNDIGGFLKLLQEGYSAQLALEAAF